VVHQVTGIDQDADEVRVLLADGSVEPAATWSVATDAQLHRQRLACLPVRQPGSVLLADLFLDGCP